MDTGIDTGDILYQVKVRTRKKDSVGSLYERIIQRSPPLVERLVKETGQGMIRPIPQNEDGASYYSSVREEDFRIDWGLPAETLRRWISTSPGECFARVERRGSTSWKRRRSASQPEGRLGKFTKLGEHGEPSLPGMEWLRVRRTPYGAGRTHFPHMVRTGWATSRKTNQRFNNGANLTTPIVPCQGNAAGCGRAQLCRWLFREWDLDSLLAAACSQEMHLAGAAGIQRHLPAASGQGQARPLEVFAALGLAVCRSLPVPANLVFNESPDEEWVKAAIRSGFGQVMFTDDHLDSETLVKSTGVVQVAHRRRCSGRMFLGARPGRQVAAKAG
jgi:hypothetical protein